MIPALRRSRLAYWLEQKIDDLRFPIKPARNLTLSIGTSDNRWYLDVHLLGRLRGGYSFAVAERDLVDLATTLHNHHLSPAPAPHQRADEAEDAARKAGEVNHHLIAQAQELAGQLTAVAAIVNELKADPAVRVSRPGLIARLEAALKPSTEDQ